MVYTLAMAKAPHPDGPIEVGIRELRNRLSHFLAEVAAGRSIIVTDRGRPVARLSGVDEYPPGLQRLIDEGLIRMATKPATSAKTWKRVKADGSVSELVSEQRR